MSAIEFLQSEIDRRDKVLNEIRTIVQEPDYPAGALHDIRQALARHDTEG